MALLGIVLSLCLMAAGCTRRPDHNLPFYEFQDAEGVLVMDSVRYVEDREMVGALGNEGRWIFTGEAGDAIGVCGGKEEKGGEFTVYEVSGDETHDLVYVLPNHYAFGPYRTFLGFREGAGLGHPAPETVSRMIVTCRAEDGERAELGETADGELIKALLELYSSQSAEAPQQPEGTYEERGLNLCHREYPSLYFDLRCSYHAESGTAYLKCADGTYRRLPPGLETLAAVPTPRP